MSDDIETLLRTSEVARIFDVHVRTIGYWAEEGLLPCVRIGRTIRFHRSDVEEVLEQRAASKRHHPAYQAVKPA